MPQRVDQDAHHHSLLFDCLVGSAGGSPKIGSSVHRKDEGEYDVVVVEGVADKHRS